MLKALLFMKIVCTVSLVYCEVVVNNEVEYRIGARLTTHSTGAESGWISSSTRMLSADSSRPVNSSVRRLKLNYISQPGEIKAEPPHLDLMISIIGS